MKKKGQFTPPGLVARAIVIEYLVPLVKPFYIQATKEECAIELWTSASEFNLLTKLLQDGGGKDCLVHCLSLLPPMDLKACRLVNRQLNAFILSEVWQSTKRRSMLADKWMKSEPVTEPLMATLKGDCRVDCNEDNVFVRFDDELVVYSIRTGSRVYEVSLDNPPGWKKISCSNTIVASLDASSLTVWTAALKPA